MAGSNPVSTELSRELSLFPITMMGMGMMIGAGVFLGVGNAIFVAGPGGAVLTFALNGLLAIFTAMSYAELSSAIPRAGGAYNYARLGFGRGTSFIAGWMEWFASSVAGSLYAVTFAIYTVRYFEGLRLLTWVPLSIPVIEKIVAVIVACFFIRTNYKGASETGKIGAFFTLGQTLFLAFIGVVGIVIAVKDPSRLQNFNPFLPYGWSKLLITMGFTYVAFEGYEVIAQTGDEAIDPRVTLPKAMLYSVYAVTLTYVSIAFATMVAVQVGSPGVVGAPWQWIGQFRERAFGEAISRLMPMGNFLLTLAVIFASTSALNATIYSATRASYALGRDHMLPTFFSKISRKRKTPWVALLFTGGIILIVATILPTMDVASSASIMFLLLFFLVNICVIKVRWDMADELTYGFIMPLFPLFPVIAIICQALLAVWLIHMSLIAWIVAPVWVLSGFGIYHFYSKSRAVATEDEILVLEEEKAEEGKEYRIMVPVANPKNALEMVRTTYVLSGAKEASVELLHMVPVPDQVPLTDAEKYMLEGKEAIVEAMLYLAPLFPISTTVRYCRSIARGIVSAVKEKKADLLIMGWHGQPKRSYGFSLGSTIDPIIERSPCDVILLKDMGHRKFKNILVPLAGGPNGAFALEISSILAEKDGGHILALAVSHGKRHFDIDHFIDEHRDRLRLSRERIQTKTVKAPDITEAILREAADYDLIVLGYTRQPRISRVVRDSIPEIVARKSPKPLLIVKTSGGFRSIINRWI
ncbi:MAG: amino acid permease [bacterium]